MWQVFLSAVIAVGVCLYNNKVIRDNLREQISANSLKTYKELITTERIKWINSLRESMADYLSKAYYFDSLYTAYFHKDLPSIVDDPVYKDLSKASFLIQLKLNPKDKKHKKLNDSLIKMDGILIDFFTPSLEKDKKESYLSEYEAEFPALKEACIDLLKEEWEKVKKEVGLEEIGIEKNRDSE